ncbi:MAG: hypothetical protein PVH62_10490 [Anaerolineae bacterium]|jgi:hypothetical protein
MTQRMRILAAIGIVIFAVGAVLGVDALRRRAGLSPAVEGEPTVSPGGIPIYWDGTLVGSFNLSDLEQLERVSFVEATEGKAQEGWLLRDVILLYVDVENLSPETLITVSSSSRQKSAQLTWAEAEEPENWVMFDLSNRGTLKLVSRLEELDTRDEWIQDADKIEITPP